MNMKYSVFLICVEAIMYLLVYNCITFKESALENVTRRAFVKSKSVGVQNLLERAAESITGLSERHILKVTTKDCRYKKYNAKFTNKVYLCPGNAKDVQAQHPIDLIDLKDMVLEHDGKSFRCVFSLMDVFSRYQ